MKTSALNKIQLQRLESITKDMLTTIATDEDYIAMLQIIGALPDGLVASFAQLGFMYLATERARRAIAQSN
jgi:hypothetical protein